MRSLLIIVLLLSLTLTGCSSELSPELTRTYSVADRQLPPDPVYSRLRWGHLPEVHPVRHKRVNKYRPVALPVLHFSIDNKPLCDAAAVLAGSARYSSYCSSLLKEETITLEALGTIDELGELIEKKKKDLRVVIDHNNREVRFILDQSVKESFLSLEGEGNEY